eukprot:1811331-Pleurochrysis_carterae.AAC.1
MAEPHKASPPPSRIKAPTAWVVSTRKADCTSISPLERSLPRAATRLGPGVQSHAPARAGVHANTHAHAHALEHARMHSHSGSQSNALSLDLRRAWEEALQYIR